MEISLTDGGNLATILLVAVGLFLQSWRQVVARQKQDELIRQRFINNADRQASDIENLRSKIEENESRYQDDKKADAKRHQLELEARDNVIRNLEATIIEHLQRNEEDRKQRAASDIKEREYYRETINAVREDARKLMEIASDAQRETERKEQEKERLSEDNLNLRTTVTGQRETIIQLETRLHNLTEERNRLSKELEKAQTELQAAQQENAALKAEIARLTGLIEEKDREIARLNTEIQSLKRGNINAAMVLTAPDSAIRHPEGNDPL